MSSSWKEDPKLSGIDPDKLALLESLASQSGQKKSSEMLPFLMAASSTMNSKGKSFSPEEVQLIIDVIKSGKNAAQAKKIDQIVQMAKGAKKK